MSSYTPTTETVREVYGFCGDEAAFDRWYAAEIAAAEQRGAVKALRDAAHAWRWSDWADAPRNPVAAANYVGDWIANRAEDLEGDE